MAIDIEKTAGRRLRVRVDMYKRTPHRRFDPVKKQAIVFTVADVAEHRAMFRGLESYLRSGAWKKNIQREDMEGSEA